MGNSSEKCLNRALNTSLIVIFILQLVGAIERQVFDFLGYMWAPIIGNFFTIACTVIGLFGACQYRPKFIIVFTVWSLLWLGWNMFVICLYLEVGVLSRTRNLYILNIGTKNKSWWLEHGVGCRITNTSWLESKLSPVDASRPIPPEEFVEGCMLQYYYVEVIHAGAQCILSIIGVVFSVVAIFNISEEDESCKYITNSRTYIRPRDSAFRYEQVSFISNRDSCATPTYVSYTDSMEFNNPAGPPSSERLALIGPPHSLDWINQEETTPIHKHTPPNMELTKRTSSVALLSAEHTNQTPDA